MKQNIFITGGAGFIGSHLAEFHLGRNDKVWVVDNLSTGKIDNISGFLGNSDFTFDNGDLRSFTKLDKAVAWADRIYHMAAVVGQRNVIAHPLETARDNLDGCSTLLNAAAQQKSKAMILIASTSSVYDRVVGDSMDTLHEDAILGFVPAKIHKDTYALTKAMNEVMALSYVFEKGLSCVIARLFNTIGPHQESRYGMVVPTFVRQALLGKPITIFGTGKQTRSFTSIYDAVMAMDMLMSNPSAVGEIVNIGSENECSIEELAFLVKEMTNSSSEIQYISYKEAYGVEFDDVSKRKPCIAKLIALTGYQPEWSLEKTIDAVIDYEMERIKNSKESAL